MEVNNHNQGNNNTQVQINIELHLYLDRKDSQLATKPKSIDWNNVASFITKYWKQIIGFISFMSTCLICH